jgi:hypothetical protein
LLNVDNPFVGDDPNVKIVIDPNDEKKQPDKDKKNIFHKEKEAWAEVAIGGINNLRSKKEATEKQKQHNKDNEKLTQYIKPMPVHDQKNFFTRFLTLEMILIKISHKIKKN